MKDFTEYYGCGIKATKPEPTPKKELPKSQFYMSDLKFYTNRIEELAGEKALLLKSQSDYDYLQKEWMHLLEENNKLKKENQTLKQDLSHAESKNNTYHKLSKHLDKRIDELEAQLSIMH